jgi:hypothetical protein
MHFVILGFAIDNRHSQNVTPWHYNHAILKLKVRGLAQERSEERRVGKECH